MSGRRGFASTRELREAFAAQERLQVARELALRLRDEKSDHPWTNEECQLLDRLLKTLEATTAPGDGQCMLCRGWVFVDAIDNTGQPYRGCARCVIKVLP